MEGNFSNATNGSLLYSVDYFSENISIATSAVNFSSWNSDANGTASSYWNSSADGGFRGEPAGGGDVLDDNGGYEPYGNYTPVGWPGNSMYPSGYSELGIILTSFFVTIIMILIVVGNMLVCIAIATEKALKTVQNWFIASLAVSDFLLGLVIMPFSLANELMGYWIFGQVWCDIHSALDVLLCTASINNLCLISLDRYWSVTQAVEYLKKRTPSRALFMICFVWALSALISLPPLVGWNKRSQKSEYPTCELSDDIGYVLYSAFGSFYIPAVVMVFVYIRIFIAARSRARRHVKKRHMPELTNDPVKEKSTTTTTCTSFSNPSPPERGKDDECEPSTPTDHLLPRKENGAGGSACSGSGAGSGGGSLGGVSVISGNKTDFPPSAIPLKTEPKKPRPTSVVVNATPQIIIETPRESPSTSPSPRRRFTSEEGDDEGFDEDHERTAFFGDDEAAEDSDAPRVFHLGHDLKAADALRVQGIPGQYGGCGLTVNGGNVTGLPDPAAAPEPTVRTGLLSATKRGNASGKSPFGSTMSLADYERSDPDAYDAEESGNSSVKAPAKKVKKLNKVKYQCDPLPARHTTSDAERHKRKVAKARERRATLILGLIMAAFILAWLPFFVLYVLDALCATCSINDTGFAVAFWLGYCNSALNPIIYTIFNRDFRRAFRKILFK